MEEQKADQPIKISWKGVLIVGAIFSAITFALFLIVFLYLSDYLILLSMLLCFIVGNYLTKRLTGVDFHRDYVWKLLDKLVIS